MNSSDGSSATPRSAARGTTASRPERDLAYELAERLLDAPSADPDDDLRTLARQLLRHRDREQRLPRFLAERAAWLKYEALNGGDWEHLKAKEDECLYLRRVLNTQRMFEDGRPSWLVNAIPVDGGAKPPSTTEPDAVPGMNT